MDACAPAIIDGSLSRAYSSRRMSSIAKGAESGRVARGESSDALVGEVPKGILNDALAPGEEVGDHNSRVGVEHDKHMMEARRKLATKVVFLDCDGVLANYRSAIWDFKEDDNSLYHDPHGHQTSLERRCLLNLKRVLDETGAVVVLSTSWRLYPAQRTFLVSAIETIVGVPGIVIGDTPNLGTQGNRGLEIDTWLQANAGVTSYVVFEDDMKRNEEGMKAFLDFRRVVVTIMHDDLDSMNEGITSEKADAAIEILGPVARAPVSKSG
jgi:hypothetical protein